MKFWRFAPREPDQVDPDGTVIRLPPPVLESQTPVELALQTRRSVREFADTALTLDEVAQLLWAAQGLTDASGHRTVPSAGALYPLEVHLLAGQVDGLPAGVYRYRPHGHVLMRIFEGDTRQALQNAALNQSAMGEAAAVLVISAIFERTTQKYGDRGVQYVHAEVGSAAQSVYLQAVSLKLGTVYIGAFDDERVSAVMQMPVDEKPVCLMPVGRPKAE